MKLRYAYTVEIEHEDGKELFYLSCPDVPEIIATGESLEEAKCDLIGLILFTASEYRKDGRLFPVPVMHQGDFVELSFCQTCKILLINAMVDTGTKPADLAHRLHLPKQRITPLINPLRSSRLDVVLSAIEATGKTVELSIR